jgi:hypothetical protein
VERDIEVLARRARQTLGQPNHYAPRAGPRWVRATPRERELFGFPAIGDPYWNDQTLTDVQCRYPRMDMTPYSGGAGV